MVARYTKKRAKYTYAERVLGALSDIQKEHRKHAVHLATLRAHVRKTADARKDKMGPQWSNWVSRTVHKLAEDGILDTSDPHGNIAFTPDAKKTITKVRRESMGPGVVLSPGLERRIWKDVTRRFSGVGVKRPRPSTSTSHRSELDDERDDEHTPPRKRQARKSLSRMTKAELEEELRDALKRLSDTRELQPINAEELSVLQEELSDREKEVAVLREELARLKERPETIDRSVTVGTPTRMLTPPPTNASLPSSSGRAATGSGSRLAMHGVTRTLSGSLISNISKQPTPEPSDAGSQDSDVEELIFHDMKDVSMTAFPEVQEVVSRPQPAHGLATPQSSPLLADRAEIGPDVYSQDGIENGARQGRQIAEEIAKLRGELESRSLAFDRLRDEHDRLLSECAGLRVSVRSRDDRIQALEHEVHARDEALSSSELRSAGLEHALAAERARRCELEAALEDSKSALSGERDRSAALDTNSRELRSRCDALAAELAASQLDASEWRTAHQEKEEKLNAATLELTDVREQLHSLQVENRSLKEALAASNTLVARCTAEQEQTTTALAQVQDELARAKHTLEEAHASQETLAARIAELERNLGHAQERARTLSIAKEALERTSGNLQDTVDQLREELSHAKALLESTRAELRQSKDVISELRRAHAQALADASAAAKGAAASRATVSELELTVDKLRSQLQEAVAETASLRKSLETERARRHIAESEAVATKASHDKLLSDLTDKTAQLSSAVEELALVRRAEAEVRRQLSESEDQRAADLVSHAAEKSAMEHALKAAQVQGSDLEAQVEQLTARLSTLSDELATVLAEKDRLSAQLHEAIGHSAALEEHLELARGDVREAEEEIEELRKAKAEDEASIQSLKAGLARLRQLQLDAMNEVDSKMISAHTAPMPGSRRRSSIAPRMSSGTLG
ncbi:hypothetical protein BV20DRAFT_548113 [Pilatotrama ljubarskyi]|nr:hypothetical protein BV20DRAFT_548113 [Pilatotrama ljubarskyi]